MTEAVKRCKRVNMVVIKETTIINVNKIRIVICIIFDCNLLTIIVNLWLFKVVDPLSFIKKKLQVFMYIHVRDFFSHN